MIAKLRSKDKRCISMPPVINLKTVTNNVGWSARSKTSTFGLKFVALPILAGSFASSAVVPAAPAMPFLCRRSMNWSMGDR
jgi:hypothetical protein